MKQTEPMTAEKPLALRVLIADDNPGARTGLRALLQSFRQLLKIEFVGEAVDGAEAVELSELNHPDLILLDANMPRMNGIEATERVKAAQPDVKIIVLSVNPAFQKPASSAGADAFLAKGFTPLQLHQTILKVVQPR